MALVRGGWLAVVAAVAALHCGTAAAQDREAELDALIDATETDAGALALARRQADAGDLTGAAATLERSLLLRSSTWSDDVRLYYGTVLCRLGDYRRGAYQLSNVRNVAAAGWAEAREACRDTQLVTVATRGNGMAGIFSLGVGYDSDAYGALTAQFDFPGLVTTEEGASINASAVVNAQFSSSLTGHGYAGMALKSRNSISGPDVDYHTAAFWAGYARHLSGQDRQLAGGAVLRHSILPGDGLLTEYGLQGEYSFGDGGTGRWIGAVEAANQDYVDSAFGGLRDGGRYEVSLSYRSTPALARVWTAGAAIEVKEAEDPAYAYHGVRVFAAGQIPITEAGAYVGASGMVRYAEFPDTPVGQNELRVFLRAAAGMPLNDNGLFVEAAASYSGRSYDDSVMYDYSSVGVELRLVYRFGL